MNPMELEGGQVHRGSAMKGARSLGRSLVVSDEQEDTELLSKTTYTPSYFLGISAALFSVVLMIGFIYFVVTYKVFDDGSICKTSACRVWANNLHSKMNLSVHPCDDFYQYACGGWIEWRKQTMKSDGYKAEESTLHRLTTRILETLRDLLEHRGRGHRRVSGMIKKVYKFYDACIDTTTIDSKGGYPLLEFLAKISIEESGDIAAHRKAFAEQIARLAKWDVGSLISLAVGPDLLDSSYYTIHASQGDLMLRNQADYLEEDANNKEHVTHLKDYIAKLMNLSARELSLSSELQVQPITDEMHRKLKNYIDSLQDAPGQFSDEKIRQRAEAVVNFEKNISIAMMDEDKLAEQEYGPENVSDLAEKDAAVLDWNTLLYNFLQYESNVTNGIGVPSRIAVKVRDFFSMVGDIISAAEFEVLADYLRVRLLYTYASKLGKEYREANTMFKNSMLSTTSVSPRWKRCSRKTNRALGFALGSAFIAKNWTGQSLVRAQEIIKDIQESFKMSIDSIDNIRWMDPATRQNALSKILDMTANIGEPSEFQQSDDYRSLSVEHRVKRFYRELLVYKNDYFGNEIRASYFLWNKSIQLLPGGRREDACKDWQITPATPHVWYSRSKNSITFTAGVLQPPLFHTTMPYYLNFGGVGTMLAQAIIHGFDVIGSKYDSSGAQKLELPPEVRTRFVENAKCFVDQYSNYQVDIADGEVENVSGKQTLAENIADSDGLMYAYKAYRAYVQKNGQEARLPDPVNLTAGQLFFVSFAHSHCRVALPDRIRSRLVQDYHAPPRYRVLGALSNSEDFAEEFGCRKPANRCSLF